MARSEVAYWLARADDEAERAAASPIAKVRRTHEALETACREQAARAHDRDIVLGEQAPSRGCHVVATAGGYRMVPESR